MQRDTTQVTAFLTPLRSCYSPSQRIDEVEWAAACQSYTKALSYYPESVLRVAFGQAIKHHARFFPSHGELQLLANNEWRKRQEIQGERDRRLRDVEEAKQIEAKRDKLPWELEKQRRYIEAAKEPFDKLARIWECESKNLKIRPDQETPPELHKQRMTQFWAVYNKMTPKHEGLFYCPTCKWIPKRCSCGPPHQGKGSSSPAKSSTPSPVSRDTSGARQSNGV